MKLHEIKWKEGKKLKSTTYKSEAYMNSGSLYWCDNTLINTKFAVEEDWEIVEEKIKGWMNIYYCAGIWGFSGSTIFRTEKEADENDSGAVACIEVEFEEGQGL